MKTFVYRFDATQIVINAKNEAEAREFLIVRDGNFMEENKALYYQWAPTFKEPVQIEYRKRPGIVAWEQH